MATAMPIVKDKPFVTLPLCTAAATNIQSVSSCIGKSLLIKRSSLFNKGTHAGTHNLLQVPMCIITYARHMTVLDEQAQMELNTHLGWLSWPLSHC